MKEKILKSLNSSDLSDEEWENSAHIVASLGAAQIGPRNYLSIGALLLHIRAGHNQFIPRVLGLLGLNLASKARRNNWKGIGRHNSYLVASVALERFLDPNCGACNGVGKIGEFGQVIVICQTCKGSGKRKDEDRKTAEYLGMSLKSFRAFEIHERIKDVIAMMDRMEGYACGGTRQQARGS